jgi:hypothetical protein
LERVCNPETDRNLLVYIAWQLGLATNQQIGDEIGLTYSSFSQRVSVVKKKLYKDKELVKKYQHIKSIIKIRLETAARIYEAIGPNIIRDRQGYWQNRIYVGFFGKMFHTMQAISSLTVNPKLWHLGRLPVHNGELRTALHGLPGANSET